MDFENFENPFANCGKIIYDERFIGRKESLKVIERRTIRPKKPGNLAIIGQPRIGKSSLVHKAVIECKDKLIAKKLLPIKVGLGTYSQPVDFFCFLVTECQKKMKELDWLTGSLQLAVDQVLENELSWNERYNRIQRFFEKVSKAGYQVLFVLDEFDHARFLFKDNVADFQKLRELASQPELGVTLITISRRSIKDIELQSGPISNLANIFRNYTLAMFSDEDLEEYFKRFALIGIPLSLPDREKILFYCGGFPYLLGMLGFEIVEIFRETQAVDVEKATQDIAKDLLNQYEHIIDLLKEDKSFDKLLQILFGPVIDVKQTDVDEFLRYGLIKAPTQKTYVGFSGHFHMFLELTARETDLWPLWSNTEKSLRNLITTRLSSEYGEDWISKLEKSRPNLKAIFNSCRKAQQKEEKTFGNRAAHNLINFTYPNDLFAIISAEWKIFESIFGKDKPYWNQRAQLLAKIRNPLAHNRDSSLCEHERQIAEGYCKEILAVIKQS